MPIDIGRFERESSFDAGETNAERILRFLASNDDKAYERGEIADGTGIDVNSVSAVLSRLKERKLVRHKPPYWAIGDMDRVLDAVQFHRTVESLNETLGPEDMTEWRAAVTDEPHPSDRESEDE